MDYVLMKDAGSVTVANEVQTSVLVCLPKGVKKITKFSLPG